MKESRESIGVLPAIALNSSGPANGLAPAIFAAVFGLIPGIHLNAVSGSRFTFPGTGSAVIDRIPWPTTTASSNVPPARIMGIPARIGYDPISSLAENGPIDTKKIEDGVVLVPYRRRESAPNAQVTLSSVAIVTEAYLSSYIIDTKNAFEALLSNDKVIIDFISYERFRNYNTPASDSDIEF